MPLIVWLRRWKELEIQQKFIKIYMYANSKYMKYIQESKFNIQGASQFLHPDRT